MTRMTRAQEDGYVECSECGHVLEHHDRDGCPLCRCPTKVTKQQVGDIRQREGLSRRWVPGRLGV